MAYYDRFGSRYEEEMAKIEHRRDSLIQLARSLAPEDLEERITSGIDDHIEVGLKWVSVPDPRHPALGPLLDVRPVLLASIGNEEAEQEIDHFDRGINGLIIEGRMPSLYKREIGHIYFYFSHGEVKQEPEISIRMDARIPPTQVRWDSADAELFLRLAESALSTQPSTRDPS
jgi:hypothetical protein